jgi:hypothetical protein
LLRIKTRKLRGGNDGNITERPMSHQSPFNKAGWGLDQTWLEANSASGKRGENNSRSSSSKEANRSPPHRRRDPKRIRTIPMRRRSLRTHCRHVAGRHARQRHKAPLRPSWGGKYADLHELHNDG